MNKQDAKEFINYWLAKWNLTTEKRPGYYKIMQVGAPVGASAISTVETFKELYAYAKCLANVACEAVKYNG